MDGLLTEPTLLAIKNMVKTILADNKGSHDLEHTERVYRLCLHLGEKEGAKLDILKLAALLHDIGRHAQDQSAGSLCHAQLGARMAHDILRQYPIPEALIEPIKHCILTHRFRDDQCPKTLEAKVLFDADKLDGIGAVGIGRAFLFAGEIGATLHNPQQDILQTAAYSRDDTAYREYMVKLRHVKKRMLTAEGKKMALSRHRYMVNFFKRLNQEWRGER